MSKLLRSVDLRENPEADPFAKVTAITLLDHFVIFEDPLGWNVTHLPTRCHIVVGVCCAIKAAAIVDAISGAIDWSLPKDQLQQAGRDKNVLRDVKAVACPNVFCEEHTVSR